MNKDSAREQMLSDLALDNYAWAGALGTMSSEINALHEYQQSDIERIRRAVMGVTGLDEFRHALFGAQLSGIAASEVEQAHRALGLRGIAASEIERTQRAVSTASQQLSKAMRDTAPSSVVTIRESLLAEITATALREMLDTEIERVRRSMITSAASALVHSLSSRTGIDGTIASRARDALASGISRLHKEALSRSGASSQAWAAEKENWFQRMLDQVSSFGHLLTIRGTLIDRIAVLTSRERALADALGDTYPALQQIHDALESTFHAGVREQFDFGLAQLSFARRALADLQASPLQDYLKEQNRDLQRMLESVHFGPSAALGLSEQFRALADYDFILAREYIVPEPPELATEYLQLMKGTVGGYLDSVRHITLCLEQLGVDWETEDDFGADDARHPIEDIDEAAQEHHEDWDTPEDVRRALAGESAVAFEASQRLVKRTLTLFELLEATGRSSMIKYSATIFQAALRLNAIVAKDMDSFRDFTLFAYMLILETPPDDIRKQFSNQSKRSTVDPVRILSELRGVVHNPALKPDRAAARSESRGKAFKLLCGTPYPTNVSQWALAQRALADMLSELIDEIIHGLQGDD